jgi:hypothetical protein
LFTLQLPCSAAYTLSGRVVGTFSVAAAVLQGASSALPNALSPMNDSKGSVISRSDEQKRNAPSSIIDRGVELRSVVRGRN